MCSSDSIKDDTSAKSPDVERMTTLATIKKHEQRRSSRTGCRNEASQTAAWNKTGVSIPADFSVEKVDSTQMGCGITLNC